MIIDKNNYFTTDLMFQERLGHVSPREELPSFALPGPKRMVF
jgi:hypothetical protein